MKLLKPWEGLREFYMWERCESLEFIGVDYGGELLRWFPMIFPPSTHALVKSLPTEYLLNSLSTNIYSKKDRLSFLRLDFKKTLAFILVVCSLSLSWITGTRESKLPGSKQTYGEFHVVLQEMKFFKSFLPGVTEACHSHMNDFGNRFFSCSLVLWSLKSQMAAWQCYKRLWTKMT